MTFESNVKPVLFLGLVLTLTVGGSTAYAEVSLPSIFGDHMVLQRGQVNPVWGWADPGEQITVSIGDQSFSVTADREGAWKVRLQPMEVGAPLTLTVQGNNNVTFQDILVGEVWLCSGQSNMAWPVQNANDPDLEIRTANYAKIRLISVPQVGTQSPQKDFEGKWEVCSPQTAAEFSAVGYFFGRQLHQTLDVPIGLIDNAWGGSAAEAWVRRDLLESDSRYDELLERWAETARTYDHEAETEEYERKLVEWRRADEAAKQSGRQSPNRPRAPRNPLIGQHRPANLFNGVLNPIIGYGMRGAIWYQGEANASRAYQYRHLFPLMIQCWRNEWKQGDFPFYWVQLADFRDEKREPGESDWAELREAQSKTLDALPNLGQAVIIDLGEAQDIHPRNKQVVAKRLTRWALANEYGLNLVFRSPEYKSSSVKGVKIIVSFDYVGGGLDTFDARPPIGFAIAGKDKQFHWAEAKIISETEVEVWSDSVAAPVAVRYAWADNPVCNLQNVEGLKATPFRTDDWPGVTIDVHK